MLVKASTLSPSNEEKAFLLGRVGKYWDCAWNNSERLFKCLHIENRKALGSHTCAPLLDPSLSTQLHINIDARIGNSKINNILVLLFKITVGSDAIEETNFASQKEPLLDEQ